MAAGKDIHDSERDKVWSRLMAAAQTGDQHAYARLLHDVVPYVRAIIRSHHRTADRIEDIVQDVLLTVHRVRHTYDPSRPFVPWIAAIARRRSIDGLRRWRRTDMAELFDQQAYETFADPRAKRESETSDRVAGLGDAIAALPAKQRQAVEMLKLREMSLAEASGKSGKSIAALKVNVHRAIKALRARLGKEVR